MRGSYVPAPHGTTLPARHRRRPASHHHVAAGGMATLVTTSAPTSPGARWPATMRAAASSVVPATHARPDAAATRRCPAAAAASATTAATVMATCRRRRPRWLVQCRPCSARISASSRLPRCAGTLAHHGPLRNGWRVAREPCTNRQPRGGPHGEVAVLPVRPGEPLVETPQLDQRVAPHRQIGRDPSGVLECGHVALLVGQSPVRGPRHDDLGLRGRDVGRSGGKVGGQSLGPRRHGDDVVVEEDDPRCRRGFPPEVPSRRRTSTVTPEDGRVRCQFVRHGQGRTRGSPVVHEHDRPRSLRLCGQRVQQRVERAPTNRRHDDRCVKPPVDGSSSRPGTDRLPTRRSARRRSTPGRRVANRPSVAPPC